MKFLFLILFAGIHSVLLAQHKGKIYGLVHSADSSVLEKATVSIIDPRDSSVLSYSLTDAKGKFEFVRIPQHKDLLLFISHINSNPFHRPFKIDHTGEQNFGIVTLEGKSIDEVVVMALPPVRMNKDTLEYNAQYFKTRPNANVEELLKELPGLQVNMDGTIFYEGKEVSQVKVDGKDFFDTDVRVATRNLDASLIKTVQVYRDRGESKKSVDDEENLPITINLKFKNQFLRTDFGKMYGSGGTGDRYEAGALFNTFRDTLQISFIAYGNNINRESFDYNELNQQAGLGRSENYGFNDFGGRNYWGIGNDMAGGFNLNNDWGRNPKAKNTKLNIMYLYKYKKNLSENSSNSITRLEEGEQITTSQYNFTDQNHRHHIKSLLRHRFDSTAYFEIRPEISFINNNTGSTSDNASKTVTLPLNDMSNNNASKGNTIEYVHSIYIEKQLSEKHIISARNSLRLNQVKSTSNNDQQTIRHQVENSNILLWEDYVSNNSYNNLTTTISYNNKMFKKLNFESYITYQVGKDSPYTTFLYDRNGSGITHGSNYENNYTFLYQDLISSIRFNWTPIKKLIVNFGTAYQIKTTQFDFLSINDHRDHSEGYWLPNINIRYKDVSLGWSKDLRNPSTYSVQQQLNDLNSASITLPSLDFDNVQTQEAFISYNKYGQKIQFGSRVGVRYENVSVGRYSQFDLHTGDYISRSYQSGSRYNLNGYVYFRYNFKSGKDWQFYTSTQPYLYSFQNYQIINDIANKGQDFGININQEFSVQWKGLIGIAPKYTLQISKNTNSVKDNILFTERNFLTHDIGFGVNIHPIKGFSLETTYSLQNRASGLNSRANFNIINSSLYYTLKNNSQLKLSAFDILNQNVQNYWGMGSNTTYYGNSLTLRQYFLLGYIHKFNMTKTKK